jgi:S1-C subfamily serine protease
VIRYGATLSFDVKLAEAEVPQAEAAPVEVASRPGNALIGIQVSDLTPALAEQFNLSNQSGIEGVIVTGVARFGPAESAGLAAGWLIQRVNGKSVRTVREFDRTLRDVKPGGVVSLGAVAAGPDGSLTHRIINIEIPQD